MIARFFLFVGLILSMVVVFGDLFVESISQVDCYFWFCLFIYLILKDNKNEHQNN